MKIDTKKYDFKRIRNGTICVAAGTGAGLIVYIIFLRLHISIFGWNLGLIFAPLVAGYVETILANKIIGENIGAISAFILFIDTTFYSFILKNPTLGFNFITVGATIVILQAAFPTAVNYIIIVIIGGILSNFSSTFKKIGQRYYSIVKEKQPFHWKGKPIEDQELMPSFDEKTSNEKLNNLNFFFLTSTDMKDKKHELLELYHSEVVIEKDTTIIKSEIKYVENASLVRIKEGKDECLIKLAKLITENGGNGILDLTINYSLIGFNKENIQITAMGIGIKIE